MARSVSDISSQNTVMMTFAEMLEASTTVSITNEAGDVLLAVQPLKSFQSIVVSSPLLVTDETLAIGYGGTVKGKLQDGVTTDATIENVAATIEFQFNSTLVDLK